MTEYRMAGSGFGAGSASTLRNSLTVELRIPEFPQRLRDIARNVMIIGEGSAGDRSCTGAVKDEVVTDG